MQALYSQGPLPTASRSCEQLPLEMRGAMAMLQDKLAAKLKEKQLAMKKHHKKVKKEYVGDEVERPKATPGPPQYWLDTACRWHHPTHASGNTRDLRLAPAPTPATPVLWEEVIRCGQVELEETLYKMPGTTP